MFDPFNATYEEAVEAQERSLSQSFGGPVHQWVAARRLSLNFDFYRENPLAGVAVCASAQLALPSWLSDAFLERYRKVALAESRSWDEAFGPPYVPGHQVKRAVARQALAEKVILAACDLLYNQPDLAVGKLFWEDVAERVGLGATSAEDIYRDAMAQGWAPTIEVARRAAQLGIPFDAYSIGIRELTSPFFESPLRFARRSKYGRTANSTKVAGRAKRS